MSVATEPAATFVFVLMRQRKQVEDAFSILQRHFRFVFLVYECLLFGLDVLISKGYDYTIVVSSCYQKAKLISVFKT